MAKEIAQAPKGPVPTGRRYQGVPIPFFFMESSAEAFRNMEMRPDDVIMSSLGKGGTTWVNKILFSLLKGFDDQGQPLTPTSDVNKSGQLYPEALPIDAEALEAIPLEGMEVARRDFFGKFTNADLQVQPAPRLFSTHLFGSRFLPIGLLGECGDASKGTGRLVVVLRNLKDVMASLHFFRGEAKDGWLGNEHGPGSFNRFIADDCPNAYGSAFTWVKEMDDVYAALASSGRVCVVYFEALKGNLPAQLDRINSFLGLPPLTKAKRDAVAAACGFGAMKSDGKLGGMLLRKGEIGDWKNHVNAESWAKFDAVFEDTLSQCALAEPLRYFQLGPVFPGLPAPLSEQTLDTDPRQWEAFVRGTLVDGMMVRDTLFAKQKMESVGFVRPPSEFDGNVNEADITPGRFHLFVSGVCPWAQSCSASRHLLGLEKVVPMDIADGQSNGGWVFLKGTTAKPWAESRGDQPFWLHEVYQASDPFCTTRLTVPVLWDTVTNKIVSNDSWNILKLFATKFASFGTPTPKATEVLGAGGLLPSDLADRIDELQDALKSSLLNAVYRVGIGRMMGAPDTAISAALSDIHRTLDELEVRLRPQRFLLGSKLTAVDIRLAMTLLRYDSSYIDAFGVVGGKGGVLLGDSFPTLREYVRDIYACISPTVFWPAFRQYYRLRVEAVRDLTLPDLRPIIASAQDDSGCLARAAL